MKKIVCLLSLAACLAIAGCAKSGGGAVKEDPKAGGGSSGPK